MSPKSVDYAHYLRTQYIPHIWCPGCGHGIILKAVLRAVERLSLDKNKIAFVSGIGCSSRAVGYVDFNTLHTTHGRALAFATGVKIARPDLHVIVVSGDGDALPSAATTSSTPAAATSTSPWSCSTTTSTA